MSEGAICNCKKYGFEYHNIEYYKLNKRLKKSYNKYYINECFKRCR